MTVALTAGVPERAGDWTAEDYAKRDAAMAALGIAPFPFFRRMRISRLLSLITRPLLTGEARDIARWVHRRARLAARHGVRRVQAAMS